MPSPTADHSLMFDAIQKIIIDVTGSDIVEITPDLYLEELSIQEFPRIIGEINRTYKIDLSAKRVLEDTETLEELVSLVKEEQELG